MSSSQIVAIETMYVPKLSARTKLPINLNECEKVTNAAFAHCSSLEKINLDNCEKIEYKAFLDNSSLTEISLPKCKSIDGCVFGISEYSGEGCKNLKTVKAPMCESIGKLAFQECVSLNEVDLSNCKEIGEYAFFDCISLKTLYLPKCEKIAPNAFEGCRGLEKVVVPKGCLYGNEDIEKAQELLPIVYLDDLNLG